MSLPRCPKSGKKRYPNLAVAARELQRVKRRQIEQGCSEPVQRAYFCHACRGYHHTHTMIAGRPTK